MGTYPEQLLRQLIAQMEEGDMLKTYSNRELVEHYLETESDIAIDEILTRLWPDWAKDETNH